MANTKLPSRLLDTSAIPALNVTGDLTVDTTTLKVDSTNNRVGIGIASPGRTLHIKDGGQIKLESTSSGGWVGLDFAAGNGTYDGYMGMLDSDGRFFIDVDSNGEDLTILQNGNVGIGTNNPDSQLHVHGVGAILSSDSYFVAQIQTDRNDNGSNDDGILQFVNGSSKTVKGEIRWDESTNTFELGHGDNQGHIVIASGGNVGIGTTTSAKFEINHGAQTGALGLSTATAFKLSQATGAPAVGNIVQMSIGYGNNYSNIAIAAIRTSAAAYGTDDLVFATKSGTTDSAPTERMRITSTGEIVTGGLTSSTGQLHLYKADATGGKLVLQSQVVANATAKISMFSRLADNTNKTAYIEAYRGNINFGGESGYGKVGIGTASPGARLHVVTSGADGIALGQDTGSTNNSSRLFFNSTSGNWAVFNNSGMLNFQSGATALSTSGNYTDFQLTTSQVISRRPFYVAGNNIKVDNGYGIDFSATGNSSGNMTSEVFDDYEEGTFTPTLSGHYGNVGTTFTQGNRTGYYTKVGRTVTAVIQFSSSGVDAANNTDIVCISGLPFASIAGIETGASAHHTVAIQQGACWTFITSASLAILGNNGASGGWSWQTGTGWATSAASVRLTITYVAS